MFNAFLVWLVENWNFIITILVWGLTALAVFILAAKVYKIYKVSFEMTDTISLIFGAGWLLFIGLLGFNHVIELLQGVLN
jgi:hypothetical protein